MNRMVSTVLLSVFLVASGTGGFSPMFARDVGVWEKVEIVLEAERSYRNPYKEVEVWVDLKGPGFEKRCYGFWDGGNMFKVRVLATEPGLWSWRSGSNQADAGLVGKEGQFTAVEWNENDKQENPCRRGMVRASANGHAFEYADGTPFFLLGDTWWSAGTFRYPWYDDDKQRPIGPKAGFKDYVRYRQKQGFNCIAMVASFGNWANDDKPPEFETEDGLVLRSAWPQAGTDSAKDMCNEDGNRAFLFLGRVPGYETYFPDVERINPAYFRNLDRKIDYLNSRGFVPFIEVARRDIGPAWKRYYPWPDSYTRYIQYVWARYQANICLFSPIHFDWWGSLDADSWNEAANEVIDRYGPPPFGTLAGCNPSGSSLRWFDHRENARWITFHQIGNWHEHESFEWLTEIYNTTPALPGINGEPVYAGMHGAPGGSAVSAMNCRAHMYGGVLSGGYGGHIYGAGNVAPWGGAMWAGEVEDVDKPHIWDAIKWPSGNQMQYLRDFVLSEGRLYQQLVPLKELLEPHKTQVSEDFEGWDGCAGWAYCSRTPDKKLFLLYFERGSSKAVLSGAIPRGEYAAQWFDPRKGEWIEPGNLRADEAGVIELGDFPDGTEKSAVDWALKLKLAHR